MFFAFFGQIPQLNQGILVFFKVRKLSYQYLSTINTFVSAEEAARELGMSRVTVRRYLEYLLELKLVTLKPQYGSVGRPQNLYKIAKMGE